MIVKNEYRIMSLMEMNSNDRDYDVFVIQAS